MTSEGLSNDNITAFTGVYAGARLKKYWWMSYSDGKYSKMVGPWPSDDNITPFNAWKKIRNNQDYEFIVFPSTTYNPQIAQQEATHIWSTPELKEDFLQPRTK